MNLSHGSEIFLCHVVAMKRKIELIYFNAGGGHRSAALALQEVIEQEHPEWSVSLVNLFEVIDSERYYQKLTGFAPEDLYNLRLKNGWTRGLATELKIFQAMIRLTHLKLKKKLQQFWRVSQPDLVVSLVPNFNKVMFEALRDEHPNVSYVTVLTDMADYPPHFWIEPHQAQYLICGTEYAVSQARDAGYAEDQVIQTSGMILRPSFYRPLRVDRTARRAELNLDPSLETGLVMFGGHGSTQMLNIAKDLKHRQLIFVCGHNTLLTKKIQALNAQARHVVFGFTSDIDALMQVSDYFIGKPGPGSISESIHMNLPIITFKNASTMPQERFNTSWVSDHNYGVVISSMRELSKAVDFMIAELPRFKANVSAVHNRAVFEVVAALKRIQTQSPL